MAKTIGNAGDAGKIISNNAANQEELLAPEAAAGHLGGTTPLSIGTLATWRSQHRGPAFVKVGRLVRYRLSDLDAWLQAQRVSIGGC